MRARIRTVKPEVFGDEELWDLGQETGMPVLQAFQGLWCVADKCGRFEWRPRAIKAMVLPYWDGDFSRLLDALERARFIVRYVVNGRTFGYVRNFLVHQRPDHREPDSVLPSPEAHHEPERTACAHEAAEGTDGPSETEQHETDSQPLPPGETRAAPKSHSPGLPQAAPGWKGTEGNGREGNGTDARGSATPPIAGLSPVGMPSPYPSLVTAQKTVFRDLNGWEPPEELFADAQIQGVLRKTVEKRISELRNGPIGGSRGVFDRTAYVRSLIPRWRTWDDTDKAKSGQNTPKNGPNQPNCGLTGLEIFERKAG